MLHRKTNYSLKLCDSDKFLQERAAVPSTSALLFSHERYLEQTFAQHIFTGREAFLFESENDDLPSVTETFKKKRGRIEIVCGKEVLFQFEETIDKSVLTNRKLEFYRLENIWLDESVYEYPEDVLFILHERRDLFLQKLIDFIQVGHLFELQEKNSLNIRVVQIISSHNGFVEVCHKSGFKEILHITSTRCHSVGWTKRQIRDGIFFTLYNDYVTDDTINLAPSWLFDLNPLREHNFFPGMLLEVIDPINRMSFYPAIVLEVHNKFYFSISLICDLTSERKFNNFSKLEFCHRSSVDIFPLGWCAKNNLRLSAPKGLESVSYINLWEVIKAKLFNLKLPVKSPYYCVEENFNFPKAEKKVDVMRYCEFQDFLGNKLVFIPAVIIRSSKHIIWIHLEANGQCAAPLMCSNKSNRLFRWGFANKSGFKLISNVLLPTIRVFDLSTIYTSQKTMLFCKNKRNFLSNLWLTGNVWLPAIHFNSTCFNGPFLNYEKSKSISSVFGPGPLPLIIASIIKEIVLCSHRVSTVINLLQANKTTSLPTLQINFKKSNFCRQSLFVESCQQSHEFPGWLRMFLIRLDACPNLLSIDKHVNCPAECGAMSNISFMQANLHVNTQISSTAINRIMSHQLSRRTNLFCSDQNDNTTFKITIAEKSAVEKSKKHQKLDLKRNVFRYKHSAILMKNEYQVDKKPNHRKLSNNQCAKQYINSLTSKNKDLIQINDNKSKEDNTCNILTKKNNSSALNWTSTVSSKHRIKFCCPSITSNPGDWSCQMLANWIRNADHKFDFIAQKLIDEEVDGEAFMMFKLSTFTELGLKLGPAVKIQALVEELKKNSYQKVAK